MAPGQDKSTPRGPGARIATRARYWYAPPLLPPLRGNR